MFGALAMRLYENGWTSLLPLHRPGKRPILNGWQAYNKHAPTPEQVERWASTSPWAGIGLAVGPDLVMGVDIDSIEPTTARKAQAATMDICGPTPLIRIGMPPKSMLLYRRDPLLVPKGKAFGQYEIYSTAGQFVLYAIHPDTNAPYHWPVESPETVSPHELPVIDAAMLAALHEALAGILPKPSHPAARSGNGPVAPPQGHGGAIDTGHMLRVINGAVDPIAAVADAITSAVEGSRHYTMVAGCGALIIKGFRVEEITGPIAEAYTAATGRDSSTVADAARWAAATFGEAPPLPDTSALWKRKASA